MKLLKKHVFNKFALSWSVIASVSLLDRVGIVDSDASQLSLNVGTMNYFVAITLLLEIHACTSEIECVHTYYERGANDYVLHILCMGWEETCIGCLLRWLACMPCHVWVTTHWFQ